MLILNVYFIRDTKKLQINFLHNIISLKVEGAYSIESNHRYMSKVEEGYTVKSDVENQSLPVRQLVVYHLLLLSMMLVL